MKQDFSGRHSEQYLKDTPHGTGMNSMLQQVSGAIGSALLITIMNTRAESKAAELTSAAMANMDANEVQSEQAIATMQAQIMNEATLNGINFSFFVSTLIALLALVLALFIRRMKPNETKNQAADNIQPNAAAKWYLFIQLQQNELLK